MSQSINALLRRVETDRNVRVVFASEAGSRVFGWDSVKGSDYDVRFVYVLPLDRYFSLGNPKAGRSIDFTEGDFDAQGLELGHALSLLVNSNPNLLEQVFSPFIYRKALRTALQDVAYRHFKPVAAYHHYLSQARTNWFDWQRTYPQNGDRKPIKKLMVVTRCLLFMLAVTKHGAAYVNSFNSKGVYELAKEFMGRAEYLAFHNNVLALREVAERSETSETAIQEWIKRTLGPESLPPRPTQPLAERSGLKGAEDLFMQVVLACNKQWSA